MGVMPTANEFQIFITEFKYLYNKDQTTPLAKLMVFFAEFERLLEQNKSQLTVPATPEPTLLLSEYELFFDTLKPLYTQSKYKGAELNVWQQAGLKRDEVRNTAVLAWWLDCYGSHGLGNILMHALIEALPHREGIPPLLTNNNNYKVQAESLPLGQIENRIDIELMGSNFLIFIEVKIDAQEGYEQLSRYRELIQQKADRYAKPYYGIIYLTKLTDDKKSTDECISLNWKQLSKAFRQVNLPANTLMTQALLNQFCDHIEQF